MSPRGPGNKVPEPVGPFAILREATQAVPAVKYALGVAGIASAVALIYSLRVSLKVAVLGTVVMLVLMTVLVVFARLASLSKGALAGPAVALTWFSLLLLMTVSTLLVTCVFFRWPLDLSHWLDNRSALAAPAVTRILLQARDSWEHPLDGYRFAYAGVASKPSKAGATELDLPKPLGVGQQIKILLYASPKPAEEWFLVNPQVNIPSPTSQVEVVLMRRGELRQAAAAVSDALWLAPEDSKRALVEIAAQHGLTAAQLETAIRSFAETQDPRDRGVAALLRLHFQKAEELLSQAAERQEHDLVDTLRYLGDAQFKQAKYAAAVTSFRKALALRTDDPVLMSDLGFALFRWSQWREAEPLMRRALDIDQKTLGQRAPRVARDLGSLAQLLQATNRLAEAEPLARRALDIDEKAFGPQHFYVAADLNDLAQILQDRNRLAEAERLLRRCLDIDQTIGPLRPAVARDLNNLAILLWRTNRSAEAEPRMRRALAIDEKILGADHPYVATHLNNLAEILKTMNRLAEAETLLRRALEIDQKRLGPTHPNVARDLNNLGRLLQDTNRSAEAEPLIRSALSIAENKYGPRHPRVASCLSNLALVLESTNRVAEAERLMRRVLEIDQENLEQHPNLARHLDNLARLLQDTNRLAEAEPLMRRALGILFAFERSTGFEHPDRAMVSNHYRALLRSMGKSEAEIDAAIGALVQSPQ